MSNLHIMNKYLYILRGVPGCGKSTVAQTISEHVFEADQFFLKGGVYNFDPKKLWLAHKSCQERLEKAMQDGKEKLVLSNTTTTNKELQPYLDLANKYGYQTFVLVVEKRHGGANQHGVPVEKIGEMADRLKQSIVLA